MRERYNNGDWTEARFNSFVKGALRSASQRWPPKYQCLNEAKRGKKTNPASGRLAEHYECEICHGEFPAKEVQVDHIEAIGKFVSWDQVVERMFCESVNLQVACKPCHKAKTKQERINDRSK